MRRKVVVSEELVGESFQFFFDTLNAFSEKFATQLEKENIDGANAWILCASVFSSWVIFSKGEYKAAEDLNSLENILSIENHLLGIHYAIAEQCKAYGNVH